MVYHQDKYADHFPPIYHQQQPASIHSQQTNDIYQPTTLQASELVFHYHYTMGPTSVLLFIQLLLCTSLAEGAIPLPRPVTLPKPAPKAPKEKPNLVELLDSAEKGIEGLLSAGKHTPGPYNNSTGNDATCTTQVLCCEHPLTYHPKSTRPPQKPPPLAQPPRPPFA